eukprot:957820-Rhodomonas_salina.2
MRASGAALKCTRLTLVFIPSSSLSPSCPGITWLCKTGNHTGGGEEKWESCNDGSRSVKSKIGSHNVNAKRNSSKEEEEE